MNTQTVPWQRSRATWSPGLVLRKLRGPGLILLAALSLGLSWSWLPASAGADETDPVGQLVHWRDAAHDWLLVVDPETRELVVYDANNGRPLERLGADDGLPEVDSIAQSGSLLLVTDRQHAEVRLLKLPQLQQVAFDPR
ncbi:hypothetical protein ASD55_15175 [Rhodanobacter sp. Root561]|uniref:hypothetical protein n=1 Tax=Rhodanobacter sp. Root561 TaxID=1736560 RepID=UPI0006F50F43|nr:hypothetical protein [Rhodanobacter sp. Root561]KQZ68376.1 hypothetical protein ASD55_15175 [Rhodanobacter sp. Root561]